MDNAQDEAVTKALSLGASIRYIPYSLTLEKRWLTSIRALIAKDLSEPYSVYVYRYFLNQWPSLSFLALSGPENSIEEQLIGVVITKLEPHHRGGQLRGYVAMLAVEERHRGQGIATKLVTLAIDSMIEQGADEVVLETEETNKPAMKLYERLGFLRSKKLHRYYLNGNSAYRLLLYVTDKAATAGLFADDAAQDAGHHDKNQPDIRDG